MAALLVAVLVSSSGARADSIQHGSGDWARMEHVMESGDTVFAAYINVTMWNTQYYSGIPPVNTGGLGDGFVCLALHKESPSESINGNACIEAGNVTMDSLERVTVEDTFVLEVSEGDGTQRGPETATLTVTFDGSGPIFPGARAATNPSPGVEVEYELMRNAITTGSATSPSFGTVDLAGAPAVLERKNCVGYAAADSGPVEACRF